MTMSLFTFEEAARSKVIDSVSGILIGNMVYQTLTFARRLAKLSL